MPVAARASIVRPSAVLAVLAALFFLSGLSALIYQVLWLRMLGWVFGVTVHAASAVWATFMAGLAVGSYCAGRIADRIRQPVKWFGATEAFIGVTALATPMVLHALQGLYVSVHPFLPGSLAGLTAARLLIAFLVLIVPTALMGATLPLVLKASAFRSSALAGQVGLLYGSNAAGAIVGTLASGLYLVPVLGIQRTFFVAALVNAIVAVGAFWAASLAARTVQRTSAPDELDAPGSGLTAQDDGGRLGAADMPRSLWLVLVVFTLSGAVSMALEVVWFRVLVMIVRPTVYSFSLMLATILGGIAIGSYGIAPILGRRARWLMVLAVLELAIGLATIVSIRPLAFLPRATESMLWLGHVMPGYLIHPLTASLLTMLPAAVLMGVAFPIGLRLWAGAAAGRHMAARAGTFYSLNVAGAIVGSLLGGFVLLPGLGSATTLVVLAAVSFASGLALLAIADAGPLLRLGAGVLATALFLPAAWTLSDPFDEFTAQRYAAMPAVWKEEGADATVGVHEFGPPERRTRVMTINGNHQAGTDAPTTLTHRRIGHTPMLLHPDARRALVIGLGGGATPGAVSVHDGVQVDVVELSQAVVDGARWFDAINYGVVDRRNVRLRVDDGRNFLLLTPDKYDVVTADVIQPIFAGAGNIYSAEYFRLVRNVLAPGGIILQWIPGTDAEFRIIARTFLSVFPEATAWGDGSLFVGSLTPLKLSREAFEARQDLPGRRQAMTDVGIDSFDALLAQFAAGPAQIRAFVGEGDVLSDDRPMAEYFLSLPHTGPPDLSALRALGADVSSLLADR